MSWRFKVPELLKLMFGLNDKSNKEKKYQIQPKMVNPDVVRIDMSSFKTSKAVKRQTKAAKALSV